MAVAAGRVQITWLERLALAAREILRQQAQVKATLAAMVSQQTYLAVVAGVHLLREQTEQRL